ncbi:ankyrin repeat-containing domain protein [Aspergillus lucknowensis]|uniref:Ankyrin repeat-containing domain protein n=1 Tax=Aspergillus lucknowensis TaxID=176173 RepID=A0ABR4LCQ0_9EURO
MAQRTLPSVPAKHSDLVQYLHSHPDTPVHSLLKPYNAYDAVLREIFAQEPDHPAIADPLLNIVPIYNDGSVDLKIRARDLATESEDAKSKYLFPLQDEARRANGSPAIVPTLKQFQTNFSIFSEGSLASLNWDNVVAVGSSVATALLPLPAECADADSKRKTRHFYHDRFAAASDVDLFLYGLDHDQAIEKIRHIERCINDSVLTDTSVVRTKHAITIVSQYPTRHVQIVLRLYKSIAEILTGLDVDCSAVAYNGSQVFFTPRALGAYITQANHVDLSRRSPSYESRLSKYSRRGFEVYWADLDRSRVDPTIFQRSLRGIVGLARLLVLEKLPRSSEREEYLDQMRKQRGRPAAPSEQRPALPGNLKDEWEDEVPDWMEEDQISNYHTLKVPYGRPFNARKIEKILFTKDLLLNAEWNRPADRTVNLHRHPLFLGTVDDVIHDCCGSCPVPETDEEQEIADKESKIFISGDISFLTDNPGRQEIGSFHPITEGDWTEMAYLGNNAGLCQSIVDGELARVQQWLAKGVDINRRDHTGRTPLHLAAMTSTPEVLQYLVDQRARLTWRLVDGRSALHLAAARGNVEMVRILLKKSEQNEEEEARKEDQRAVSDVASAEDGELISSPSDNDSVEDQSYATGSFVKVRQGHESNESPGNEPDDSNLQGPDIYDINAAAWDTKASPLHLAILKGHVEVVEELVSSFGADVLRPVQAVHPVNGIPQFATLTLVLALALPLEQAKVMTSKLLQLGASPAQADVHYKTPLFYTAAVGHPDILDIYVHHDQPAVTRAINHLSVNAQYGKSLVLESPLMAAILAKNTTMASRLLQLGAHPSTRFEDFIKSAEKFAWVRSALTSENRAYFQQHFDQPVVLAVEHDLPSLALELLARGADPNTLTREGHLAVGGSPYYKRTTVGLSLLDYVRGKLGPLRRYKGGAIVPFLPPKPLEPDDEVYLKQFEPGTYQRWRAAGILNDERENIEEKQNQYRQALQLPPRDGMEEKNIAIRELISTFEALESDLARRGAKTFPELYPDIKPPAPLNNNPAPPANIPEFRITLDFQGYDHTEEKRRDYLKLFDAAWTGDINTIKQLTTTTTGDSGHPPLEIGVSDSRGYSSFTISVLRGHLDAAEAIIAIAAAQYKPDGVPETRYRMQPDDTDDELYASSESSDSDGIALEKRIINPQFTIENVGEIKTGAESKIKPISLLDAKCNMNLFLEEPCPFAVNTLVGYAILTDNCKLLEFLITLGQRLVADDPEDMYDVYDDDLELAMHLGRLRCLEILVKRTGAGLPLDELADGSIDVKVTPTSYRGLSVRGAKRDDWAKQDRVSAQSIDTTPPLLLAAKTGNLEAVEWFLGPAAARCYSEFVAAHEDNEMVRNLSSTKKGIDQIITDFLESRRHLLLHCAVLSPETDGSKRLVAYLAKQMPYLLEAKSADGYTPLAVTYRLRRLKHAETLIKAGANQTARDKEGHNLLHLLFKDIRLPAADGEDEPLSAMIKLIDPRLLPSMLAERCSSSAGSLTPFALWMSRFSSTYKNSAAFSLLTTGLNFVETVGYTHLDILDGSGNTQAHHAARQTNDTLDLLLRLRPELASRENAHGFTPTDVAEQEWFASKVAPPFTPKAARGLSTSRKFAAKAIDAGPQTFLKKKDNESGDWRWRNYELCCEKSQGGEVKRKLVGLLEANEVASASYDKFQRRGQYDMREKDEISRWLK